MAVKEKNKKEKINFRYNLGVYLGFLRKYKGLLFLTLFFVLVLESRHVLEKLLFKVIVDKGTEFTAGSLLVESFVKILLGVAMGFVCLVLIGVVFRWIYLHLINRLDARLILDLKRKFFNHILSLDHSFHVTHKTGSLISRLSRGARAIERMTDIITFNIAPLIFELIVVFLSIIYFDFLSAIVVLLTVVTFVAYGLFLQKIQQNANIIVNKTEDIEKGNVADIFTNIDSIKYFGKEGGIKKKFAKLTEQTKLAMIRHWDYFRWFDSGQTFILGTGTFFLVLFPILSFLRGDITLGSVVFIYTVFATLLGPLFSFINGIRDFYRSMADFQELFAYGKIEKEVRDIPGAKDLHIRRGEIEFKNIHFSYGKRKIFENFNLKISQNKKIALVGHSGCGKTTLIKLLYRLFDTNSGKILVDGKNIREVKQESLRSEMSIVPQECILFDDSVYNNVAFSNPTASRKEVRRAMKFAQLDKIVSQFSKKENTIVGERGVKLSGGERQRVSIARAILSDKKILVLDEATSSLDSETEYEIQKDLGKLMEGRTSIIIAHRLSTIMKADKIVVMKKGKIVQQGVHNHLIKVPGEYQKLWNLQKGGYIK